MLRLWMMHAAVIAVLTAGATAHAKMEMRTFPVLAGAHDVTKANIIIEARRPFQHNRVSGYHRATQQ